MAARWQLLIIIIAGWVWTSVWPARAEGPILLTDDQGEIPLGMHVDLLEDPTRQLDIAQVTSPEFAQKFSPSTEPIPNFSFSDSAHWARFELTHAANQPQQWLLELADPTLDSVTLYLPDETGSGYTVTQTGDLYPRSTRDVDHANFVFSIPFEPNQTKSIYLRIANSGAMALPLTLWSPAAFAQKDSQAMFGFGFFYGFIFIMVCYNLLICWLSRDNLYLFYVLAVIGLGLYFASLDGLAGQYLWPDMLWWGNISILLFIAVALVGTARVSIGFLDTKTNLPGIHRVLVGIQWLCVALFIPALFPAFYGVVGQALAFITIAISSLGMWTAIKVWRMGYQPARYFILAWFGLFFGAILVVFNRLGLLPINFITENGLRAGIFLLLLMLAMALIDRINLLRSAAETANVGLKESQSRFNQFIEAMPVGVALVDPGGTAHYLNQRTKEIFDQVDNSSSRVTGLMESTIFKVAGTDTPYSFRKLPFILALEGQSAYAADLELDLPDKRVPVEIWSQPVFNEKGDIIYAATAWQDITERRRTEVELKAYRESLEELVAERTNQLALINNQLQQDIHMREKTEEKLQEQFQFLNNIIESLADPFYVISVEDYRIEIANSAARKLSFGPAITCYQLTHKRDTPCTGADHPCPLQAVIDSRKPVVTEHVHTDNDGKSRIFEVRGFPVFNSRGDVVQMIEHVMDITERKQNEEQVRILSRAVEQSANSIVITDLSGSIEFVNPAFTAVTGYSAQEALGKNPRILKSEMNSPELYQELWQTIRQGDIWQGEMINCKKDGELYWETAIISPITDNAGQITHFLAVKEDISLRKEIEKATELHNQQLALINRAGAMFSSTLEIDEVIRIVLNEMHQILDIVSTSYWLITPDGAAIVCRQATGPGYEIVMGWQLALDVGLTGYAARTKYTLLIADAYQEELHYDEIDRKIGIELHSLLIIPVQIKNELLGVLNLGDTKIDRFTQQDKALIESIAAVAASAIKNAQLFRETQRQHKIADSMRKETQVALDKLQATQSQLVIQEKMASLGMLTAGIAHEIKNPLNFVTSFAQLTIELIQDLRQMLGRQKLLPDARLEINQLLADLEYNAASINDEGHRANGIVQSMLLHSRSGGRQPQYTDINYLLKEVLNLTLHSLRAKDSEFVFTINATYDDLLEPLPVLAQDISRVFVNLINNAYDASRQKYKLQGGKFQGTLNISTKNLKDYAEIRIKDNGVGISPDKQDDLFTPFFTTKPAGEGTGLGLSISYDIIVQEHQGEILVNSVPGEYTEFVISLPKVPPSTQDIIMKMLFVDDEPRLQPLIKQLFRKEVHAGEYELYFALNGLEALDVLQTNPHIDLLLTDLNMPRMNGLALLKKLQERKSTLNPALTTLVVSAYGDMENIRKAMNAGAFDFLLKPLDFDDFRTTVAKAISHVNNLKAILQREQEAQAALKKLNYELEDRIRQRTADLKRTNTDLNAFAHTVAHDLKNPLGVMAGQAGYVFDYYDELEKDEILETIQNLRSYAYKALRIIEDLMLLSGVRKLDVTRTSIDMAQVVYQSQQRLAQLIKQHEAHLTLPDQWPAAVGYGPWLEEVWVNYVSNALKYGGTPPIVELGAEVCDNEMICFWVKDNGKGIVVEDQEKLFTEFTRLHETEVEGYGLGLSIVKRIVEKLGGEVGLISQPGAGSKFYFTLPKA